MTVNIDWQTLLHCCSILVKHSVFVIDISMPVSTDDDGNDAF